MQVQLTGRRRGASLLVALALLASLQLNQITCTSSYIDDYFLPTAKLALNKIQQSFSPSAAEPKPQPAGFATARQPSEQRASDQLAAATNQPAPLDSNSANTGGVAPRDEPSSTGGPTNEAETGGPRDAGSSSANLATPNEGRAKLAPDSQQPTVLSSTDSSASDPTTSAAATAAAAAAVDVDASTVGQDEPVAQDQLEPKGNLPTGEQPKRADGELAASTEPPPPPGSSQASNGAPTTAAPVARPDEERRQEPGASSVRDTELEAVAAVDASIAFGSSSDLFSSLTDNCYDEYGNARFCEPEFENVALERPVQVSSECGAPASRFCTTYLNERNDQVRNCHICDQQHPKKRHPAAYLTDLNNPTSPTCWVSAPIGQLEGGRAQRDNVTLTLRLAKSYEITYVSLQFCSLKPDSLAIYRSRDFGASWTAYQFYSSQCKQLYGLEQRPAAAGATPAEPSCTNAHQMNGSAAQTNRIAFSTLEAPPVSGQAAAAASERTGQQLDWMTATDVRVVLDRHQSSWIQSNLGLAHHHASGQTPASSSAAAAAAANQTSRARAEPASGEPLAPENSLLSPSDTYNYALADLTVGGRCKCNGHASRCVHGLDGELQCDCRHNTAGRDCERCAAFHFDRPWQPADQFDANPCQPCQCNGHSRRCKFDPEIYQLSGKRSGGVCIQCQDNTAGRHCHYCVEGFTRDHSRPMSDPKACKPCDCHPVGSLGRVCNQTTGQCPCKEGVTGLECNRCAPGYQQSSSPSEPCIKLPENDINYEPTIEQTSDDLQQPTVGTSDAAGQPAAAPEVVSVGQEQAVDQGPRVVAPAGQRQPYATSDANQRRPAEQDSPPMEANFNGPPLEAPDEEANEQLVNQLYQNPRYPTRGYAHSAGRAHAKSHRQQHTQLRHGASQFFSRANKLGPKSRPPAGLFVDEDGANNADNDLYGDPQAPRSNGNQQQLSYQDADGEFSVRQRNYAPDGYGRAVPAAGNRRFNVDEISSLVEPDEDPMLASGQLAPGSLAVDENDSFNQINHHNHHHQHRPPVVDLKQRNHMLGLRNGNRQHHQQHNHRRRPAGGSGGGGGGQSQQQAQRFFNNQPQQQATLNSINCADCQSTSRKLSVRQFCHLDYAIKATVLNKYMAEDWTRVDVEIQDIFKSTNGNAAGDTLLRSSKSPATRNFVSDYATNDNLFLQADDPNVRSTGEQQQVATAAAAVATGAPTNSSSTMTDAHSQQQTNSVGTAGANYRLRIGSTQSIWVPTEDVSCKCPRLKLKSTYLLMGLIDSEENPTASIQLDRHGVALEWKSSLQDKLIKYQKRQAKRGC